MSRSKRLTIFEGPDGSGKTTAAKLYAAETGARYVHFSNLPQIGLDLGRMYVEAMLPALLGYQDVVFDRCWLSEMPYGTAFRHGEDRLGDASRRMLERLALRCGALVIHCRPPWEQVCETYLGRCHEEYLDNEQQLRLVYDLYGSQRTELPEVRWSYLAGKASLNYALQQTKRAPCHLLSHASAGNWEASTVLVGESFAPHKPVDAYYQWPFASFSQQGCSQWLTRQLIQHDVREWDLLWLNADQDLSVLHDLRPKQVIALGNEAVAALYEEKIMAVTVGHPQHHKRFKRNQPYELFNYIGDHHGN